MKYLVCKLEVHSLGVTLEADSEAEAKALAMGGLGEIVVPLRYITTYKIKEWSATLMEVVEKG